MRSKWTGFCALAVWLVLSMVNTSRLYAQAATATIQGTVTDASGAAVPEATVRVRNTGTGATQTTTSDAAGRFSAPDLGIGSYEVTSSKTGFTSVVHSGITLTVGAQVVVDFSLPVGQQTQTVTVEGEVTQVETTNATVGAVVSQQQMREIPLNGRNFEQLILLTPGVQTINNFSSSGFQGRAQEYSIAGSRPEGQSILLDDESLQNFWNKGMGSVTGSSLGVEAIAEFQTLTNSYGAQFGGNGGVINSVSRSGTNTFHGSAYEFFRNDKLDAFDTFAKHVANPVKPELRQNQFGGTLGGPIKKDKMFFFINYEGIRRTLGEVKQPTVPDCTAANAFTGGNCTPSASLPVATQQAIINTLQIFPAPDPGSVRAGIGISTQQANQGAKEHYGLGRFDYNLSDKDSLFARSVTDRTNFTEPFGSGGFAGAGGGLPNWPEVDSSLAQFSTIEWRRVASPTLVNTARVSFSRNATDAVTSGSNPALDFFPGSGRQNGQVSFSNGLSTIGVATQLPFNEVQNRYTEADDLIWTHGAHNVRVGASVSRLQTNTYMPFRLGSNWTFAGLSGFLNGATANMFFTPLVIPAGHAGAGPAYANRDFRDIEVTPYVQDDWKVSPKLTVNVGLRWSFITNPVDRHNQLYAITNFATATDFTNVAHVMANNPTWANFDPRAGFAYDLFGDHKTSIRGGFGMFHQVILPPDYAPAYWDQPPWTTFQAGLSVQRPATYPTIPANANPLLTSSPGFNWGGVNTTPYMIQYNLNVQRELMQNTILTVGYVGSRGVHLLTGREQNPISLINGLTTTGFNAAGSAVVPNPRLNPALGAFPSFVPTSLSRYNSLQASLTRRFSRGLEFLGSYTYSKCMDDGSYLGSFNNNVNQYWQNPYNQSYDSSVCNFDIKHTFRFAGLWALPFHGNRAVEGWQISGIVSANSGAPFTVFDGIDVLGYTTTFNNPRPNSATGNVNPVSGNPNRWFDPSQFVLAPIGTLGNLGRDTLRGPDFYNTDLALTKDTKIRESLSLQFRAEVFNLFNHVNYGTPIMNDGTANLFSGFTKAPVVNGAPTVLIPGANNPNGVRAIPNPNAGRILYDLGTPRQIQFALKLIF